MASSDFGWDQFSSNEQKRLAAIYLGTTEAEVETGGLARTADWFNHLGPPQQMNLVNAFFALGGGDGATVERRALWNEIAQLLPGQSNSNIGQVSVILELRDAERFRQAGLAAGLKEDWAVIRWLYHRGASFSLREWNVKASLNFANDTAAAKSADQNRGGGQIVRVEFDAYGPSFSLLGLLRHKYGKIDAQIAGLDLMERGLIPDLDRFSVEWTAKR